jgi:hypothetical protein
MNKVGTFWLRDKAAKLEAELAGNRNSNTVPSLVLHMKQERVDEQARRVYEIYCDVWERQGYVKSAAFVRAVYARAVVSVLRKPPSTKLRERCAKRISEIGIRRKSAPGRHLSWERDAM